MAQSTKWPLALAGPRKDPIQDGGAAVAETGSDSRMMPNGLMDVDTTGGGGGGVCGKRRVLVHIQGFGAQMLLSQSFFFPLEMIICMQECAPGRPLSRILENGRHDRKRVCVCLEVWSRNSGRLFRSDCVLCVTPRGCDPATL